MDNERRNEDARRDYDAPELIVLASVEEATDAWVDGTGTGGRFAVSV
jgi:hypothetical protein